MSHRLQSERGAELIEFALIFPLLLLLFVGLVDFGFLLQRYEVVTNAAREGARVGVLPGYGNNANVTARVQSYLTGGGVPTTSLNPVVTISDVNIGGAGPVVKCRRVQVTYTSTYLFIGPIAGLIGGSGSFTTKNLTAVAIMRYEIAP